MKIIVTGAGGFVGGALADSLNRLGHEVLPWTRAQADLTKPFDLPAADFLFHIGANAKVFIARKDPCLDLATNALGALHTLQACERAGINAVAYASSALVYEDCWEPSEDARTGYNVYGGAYGISKLAGEFYTRNWAAQSPERRFAIFRISNPYGPGMRKNLVFDAIEQFRSGERVDMRAAAEATTDFLHITDVVAGLSMALKPEFQGIFNLSADCASSTRKIIEILSALFKRNLPVTYGRQLTRVKIPNAKLRAAGWAPTFDLESGLRQTIEPGNHA